MHPVRPPPLLPTHLGDPFMHSSISAHVTSQVPLVQGFHNPKSHFLGKAEKSLEPGSASIWPLP